MMSAKSAANSIPTRQLERRHRLVLQHEVVLHAVADEALAADGDRVERQRLLTGLRRKNAAEKYSTVPDESSSGRSLSIVSCSAGEEARVLREQPVRPLADVAELVRDAERRAFENRELRHYVSRTIRPPGGLVPCLHDDLVHVTCHGRVTAHMMQSATSSAVSGSTPLIDGVRLLRVALEADDRELRLDEPGIDGRDPDRTAEQILAQRVREAAHGELRRDVRRAASRTPGARRSSPC